MLVPAPAKRVDLTFIAKSSVTVAEVNDIAHKACQGYTVTAHGPEPKVSIDFNQPSQSSIFAPDQTKVAGRSERVLACYDNEWGFSCRMADVAGVMGRLAQ